MSLMLQPGQIATYEEVAAIPTPNATHSHKPVPHVDLIDTTATALNNNGWEITESRFGLSEPCRPRKDGSFSGGRPDLRHLSGMNMWFMYWIQNPDVNSTRFTAMIAGVNSHIMTSSAKLMAGTYIAMCSNGQYHADAEIRNKHTVNVDDRMTPRVQEIIEALPAWNEHVDKSYDQYEEQPLLIEQADHHGVELTRQGILSSRMLPTVWDQTRDAEDTDSLNVWTFMNGCTDAMKSSPSQIQRNTMRLHRFCDELANVEQADFFNN